MNDRHGQPTGRCVGLEVWDDDVIVRLEGIESPAPFEWYPTRRLGGRDAILFGSAIAVEYTRRDRHVGNIHWDAITVRDDDAQRMVLEAERLGLQAVEWAPGHPFIEALEAARRARGAR